MVGAQARAVYEIDRWPCSIARSATAPLAVSKRRTRLSCVIDTKYRVEDPGPKPHRTIARDGAATAHVHSEIAYLIVLDPFAQQCKVIKYLYLARLSVSVWYRTQKYLCARGSMRIQHTVQSREVQVLEDGPGVPGSQFLPTSRKLGNNGRKTKAGGWLGWGRTRQMLARIDVRHVALAVCVGG